MRRLPAKAACQKTVKIATVFETAPVQTTNAAAKTGDLQAHPTGLRALEAFEHFSELGILQTQLLSQLVP